MVRTLQQRALVALVATVLGVATGALAGFWLGRTLVVSQASGRLDQFATRIMSEGERSTAESRLILAKLNASPYPLCSDAEIAYFRQLIFQSQYLKGAGRINNGRIECSTTLGRVDLPQTQLKPDFSQWDTTLVYRNLPQFRIDGLTVISVQLGSSFVVYNPFATKTNSSGNIHFTVRDLDAPSQQMTRLLGESPHVDDAILTRPGRAQIDGSIYATQCSADGALCTTAYMSAPEAMQTNRGELIAFIAFGGLTGGFFGFVCSLVYRRKKGIQYQLLRAIRTNTLKVVYQPIVDLATGKIVEAEALARWTDEEKHPVPPDVFIKVAEEHGFVGEITRLVVRQTLRDFGTMLRQCPDFRVNVNIAAPDLADPEFLPMLENALSEAGVSAHCLGIEITESYTARQQVAKETILQLRRKGHCVHIDDFGTGYSSLAYLHDLSVDGIKIDKAFTKAIGTDAVTVSILPQILTMADTLNLRVIVEGIETEQQANYFAAANQAIYAQGWLYGRPVAPSEFHRLLDKNEDDINGGHPAVSEEMLSAPLQVA